MTQENETTDESTTRPPEESLKDYASRRLVELKNSERQFMTTLNQAQANLERAQADLIACRGRIDEMVLIIQGGESKDNSPPEKA